MKRMSKKMETVTIKCPKTIRGMVEALSEIYPGLYISIEKTYKKYHHDIKLSSSVEIEYRLYVEGCILLMGLSYKKLKIAVAMDINKE